MEPRGDVVEYFGFLAFVLVLCYVDLPGKVKKLKREIKSIKRNDGYTRKEVFGMSKMLEGLKGRNCIIWFEESPISIGNKVKCYVEDVDEEWIKILVTNKKGEKETKLVRVDWVSEVEIGEK
ncbi:hypothetical protein [Capillibacterium thermochitinicola]|uniref:Uncharacterized protein n=1 Tax=Capillibacterium thermochitinicola TaxID=2699427 RepID=A0A8J6I1K5_9FIRM|nr:hypothetical protein [Capillibacterium thermochitinicola]MBA2132674.1 hypothetical protein [Capillibacterium thermochitinicola]